MQQRRRRPGFPVPEYQVADYCLSESAAAQKWVPRNQRSSACSTQLQLIGCHHGGVLGAWVVWDDGEIDGERIWETGYDVSFGRRILVENHRVPLLAEALALSHSRTSWVMVRPESDPGRYYWAGDGPCPLDVPTLPR